MANLDKLLEIAKKDTPINYDIMKEFLKSQEGYSGRVFGTLEEHFLIVNEDGISEVVYDELTGETTKRDIIYDTYAFRFSESGLIIYTIRTSVLNPNLVVIAQIEEHDIPKKNPVRYKKYTPKQARMLLRSFENVEEPYQIRVRLSPTEKKHTIKQLVS